MQKADQFIPNTDVLIKKQKLSLQKKKVHPIFRIPC